MVAWLLPPVEMLVGAGLLFAAWPLIVRTTALILIVMCTVALLGLASLYGKSACGCFGRAIDPWRGVSTQAAVARNGSLLSLIIISIVPRQWALRVRARSFAFALLTVFYAVPGYAQWGSDFSNPFHPLLSDRQFGLLVEYLDLDESQRAVALTFVREYQAAHRERVRALRDSQQELKGGVKGADDADNALERWRKAMEIGEAEHAARERLRVNLGLIVREDQLLQWKRFWRDHRRWTLLPGNHSCREATVDLVALVESLGEDVAAGAEVNALLEEYAGALDPLVQNHDALLAASLQRYFREREARLEGTWHDPLAGITTSEYARSLSDDDFRALNERVGDLAAERRIDRMEPERRASRRILDTNRRYLAMIRGALAPEDAETLEKRYLASAFGWHFDAPEAGVRFYGHFFLERVLEFDLRADQRMAIEEIRDRYERQFDTIAMRLIRLCREEEDEWRSIIRERMSSGPGRTKRKIDEERVDLWADRRELQERAMTAVRGLLTPEQKAAIPQPEGRVKW